jgi:cyclopropane fatty-acyl-phospholipid synthase-like methyltransferase
MSANDVDGLRERLAKTRFPRSSTYEPQWILKNAMAGPPALWLVEWLAEYLQLKPGMRVLDLGCGRATSSIFLAKEFGVTVWAADLWIKPTDNHALIEESGMSSCVFPIFARAHELPFAFGYFDAVVSVDAYHYFGTDDLYLGVISKFLRGGGRLGVVTPGLLDELQDVPPAHLTPYWHWDFGAFHTSAWWRRHFDKTGLMAVEIADALPDGWRLWLEWSEILREHGPANLRTMVEREAEMLRVDGGRTFALTRIVAQKPDV